MKISQETLVLLKNFSSINPGIFIHEGNKIRTVSQSKTIFAQAELEDSFEQDFGIYDLNNFLSVLTLSGKELPELEFDTHHVIVKSLGGRSKIKYRLTDKQMIVTPPDKDIVINNPDIKFTLTSQDYDWITKSGNVLQSPNLAIIGEDGVLKLSTFDSSNDSAHLNSIDIGEAESDFKFVFKTENLKMLAGEYDVTVDPGRLAQFSSTVLKLDYYVAIEKEGSEW